MSSEPSMGQSPGVNSTSGEGLPVRAAMPGLARRGPGGLRPGGSACERVILSHIVRVNRAVMSCAHVGPDTLAWQQQTWPSVVPDFKSDTPLVMGWSEKDVSHRTR